MLVRIQSRDRIYFSIDHSTAPTGIPVEAPAELIDRFEQAERAYEAAHGELEAYWRSAGGGKDDAPSAPTSGLTFHNALERLKMGEEIARANWPDGMRLTWQPQALPHLTMSVTNETGTRAGIWAMPATDINANDWKVVVKS